MLIYDGVFSQLDAREKGEYYRKLCDVIHSQATEIFVIYFVTPEDFRSGQRPAGYARIDLGPLSREQMERLIEQYADDIPVQSAHVSTLTGAYAGISSTLLNEARHAFGLWPGSREIVLETSWNLIRRALSSDEAVKESRQLIDSIERHQYGADLCAFIRGRIMELGVDIQTNRPLNIGEVQFTLDDLKNAVGMVAEADIRDRVKLLHRFGILIEHPQQPDNYSVHVLAPFLTNTESDRYYVFMSFPDRLKDKATVVAKRLRAIAQVRTRRLDLYLFTERNNGTRLDKEIEAQVRGRENLVVLLDEKGLSNWVENEVRTWRENWEIPGAEMQSYIVPLYFGDVPLEGAPFGFKNDRILDVTNADDLQKALEASFGEMVPKSPGPTSSRP